MIFNLYINFELFLPISVTTHLFWILKIILNLLSYPPHTNQRMLILHIPYRRQSPNRKKQSVEEPFNVSPTPTLNHFFF